MTTKQTGMSPLHFHHFIALTVKQVTPDSPYIIMQIFIYNVPIPGQSTSHRRPHILPIFTQTQTAQAFCLTSSQPYPSSFSLFTEFRSAGDNPSYVACGTISGNPYYRT
jgi:hypothetical protein